jgi:predicted nucleic acid-binding protein
VGLLTLPTAGTVYLDTQTLIYSVETQMNYWPLLKPVWEAAHSKQFNLVSSDLALLETLVGPLKRGDALLTAAYEAVLHSSEMRLLPITQDVLRQAALLRAAKTSLRTPDAIHAATAMINGCTLFLSNDTGFRAIPRLPLVLLDDVLAST